MKQERRKFFAADFSTEMNQGNQAPRNDGLGSRRQMMAGKPPLVENCRTGASPVWATGAIALQVYEVGPFLESARGVAVLRRSRLWQKAKHTRDPIFPAPGTLLSTARAGV